MICVPSVRHWAGKDSCSSESDIVERVWCVRHPETGPSMVLTNTFKLMIFLRVLSITQFCCCLNCKHSSQHLHQGSLLCPSLWCSRRCVICCQPAELWKEHWGEFRSPTDSSHLCHLSSCVTWAHSLSVLQSDFRRLKSIASSIPSSSKTLSFCYLLHVIHKEREKGIVWDHLAGEMTWESTPQRKRAQERSVVFKGTKVTASLRRGTGTKNWGN